MAASDRLFESNWLAFPVPGAGTDVLVADLDGDGALDVAMPNGAPNAATISFGLGNGVFLAPQSFPTAPSVNPSEGVSRNPTGIVQGDFDRDGRLDLAMANCAYGVVSVLLNRGNRSFGPVANYPAGPSPVSLGTGDFDSDGNLDLVVCNFTSTTLSVLLGDGAGAFTSGSVVQAGPNPKQVRVTDVNGDGWPDLVAVAFRHDKIRVSVVSVHLGTGAGSFQPAITYPTGPNPLCVAVGHLDDDGVVDMVFGEWWGALTLYRGLNNGHFEQIGVIQGPEDPLDLELGDLDDDGRADIVVTPWLRSEISVLFNLGSGAFTPAHVLHTEEEVSAVALADVDADQHVDLVASIDDQGSGDFVGGAFAIYRGNAGGGFGTGMDLLSGNKINDLASGDINGDGHPDLIVSHGDSSALSIHFGGGVAASPIHVSVPDVPTKVVTGDFNHDGATDVVALSRDSSTVSVLLGDGSGAFSFPSTHSTRQFVRSIQVVDFDADGNLDILTSPVQGFFRFFQGDGLGSFLARDLSAGANATQVVAAHMNQDDLPDLVILETTRLRISLQNANGQFIPAGTTSLPSWPRYREAVRDLDGDGRLDVLIGDAAGHVLRAFLGDGAGGFTQVNSPMLGWGYSWELFDSFEMGDVDGNGTLDMVFAHLLFHAVTVLPGAGDGTFDSPVRYGLGEGTSSCVEVMDFDGDGRLDIVAGSSQPGEVTLLRGIGPDIVTAVQVAVMRAEAISGDVHLAWKVARSPGTEWLVWRKSGSGPWLRVGASEADGEGSVLFVDRDLSKGRHCYRLAASDHDGIEQLEASEVCVSVQEASILSLRMDRNPARGVIALKLSLPDNSPARIQVLDVGGRLVERLEVPAAAGENRVESLSLGAILRPGVYFVRATQAGRSTSARVVLME